MDKKTKIVELLLKYSNGLKAREIANKLSNIDKKEVNQILYSNANDFISTDYVWKLNNVTAKNVIQEKEYKESEIYILLHNYGTPYSDTKKLADLNLTTFKIAVDHAKEVANRNLSFDLGKMWYETVTMPENLFRNAIESALIQKEKENEWRVKKLKEELQEKSQREKEIKKICITNDLTESVAKRLISSEISIEEIDIRIRKINYYNAKYPELNIVLSEWIMYTNQEFNKYISSKLNLQRSVCVGDCSTCKRDVCLMD